MRKSAVVALLFAFFAAAPALLFGQARPRVIGQDAPTKTPGATTKGPQTGQPAPRRPSEVAEEVGEDEVVRVNAALVTVPVTVLDRDGRFIPGLRQEDFRILEDGVEQEVAYFAKVEQPFTVALVIDTSGSTRFKLEDIQDAAIAFTDQLRPDDRVIVVSFDDSIRVLAEATSDRRVLRDAIRRTRTGNGTRLYDAVDEVIKQHLSRVRGRKAIVLFTDGVDTTSKRASYQSTLAEAEELDAMIYPIQYDTYTDQGAGGGGGGGGGWPGSNKPSLGGIIGIILGGGTVSTGSGGGGTGTSRGEYERAGEYLRQLSAMTGGRHFPAADLRYVEEAFSNIAEELRRQYSLGYYPSRQSQGAERRQIKVRVKRPNLVVRARDSYVYKPAGGGPASNTAQDNAPRQPAPELRRRPFSIERGGTKDR
ncbi:MAG: VWA domain-containing protein [Rubrivivax sp.]|nr:VWA domain-containing protein [Pyrinomonadaceae bacterium]